MWNCPVTPQGPFAAAPLTCRFGWSHVLIDTSIFFSTPARYLSRLQGHCVKWRQTCGCAAITWSLPGLPMAPAAIVGWRRLESPGATVRASVPVWGRVLTHLAPPRLLSPPIFISMPRWHLGFRYYRREGVFSIICAFHVRRLNLCCDIPKTKIRSSLFELDVRPHTVDFKRRNYNYETHRWRFPPSPLHFHLARAFLSSNCRFASPTPRVRRRAVVKVYIHQCL